MAQIIIGIVIRYIRMTDSIVFQSDGKHYMVPFEWCEFPQETWNTGDPIIYKSIVGKTPGPVEVGCI